MIFITNALAEPDPTVSAGKINEFLISHLRISQTVSSGEAAKVWFGMEQKRSAPADNAAGDKPMLPRASDVDSGA